MIYLLFLEEAPRPRTRRLRLHPSAPPQQLSAGRKSTPPHATPSAGSGCHPPPAPPTPHSQNENLEVWDTFELKFPRTKGGPGVPRPGDSLPHEFLLRALGVLRPRPLALLVLVLVLLRAVDPQSHRRATTIFVVATFVIKISGYRFQENKSFTATTMCFEISTGSPRIPIRSYLIRKTQRWGTLGPKLIKVSTPK